VAATVPSHPSLWHTLSLTGGRATLARQAAHFVKDEVAAASGLAGALLRSGFDAMCRARPDAVETAVDELGPELTHALEPLVRDALRTATPLEAAFEARATHVAEALVEVTDRRVARSSSVVVRGTYASLRAPAQRHLAHAAPRLGRFLECVLEGVSFEASAEPRLAAG
jgi:hypothetical protein